LSKKTECKPDSIEPLEPAPHQVMLSEDGSHPQAEMKLCN
jgi:hypothetical protein